MQATEADSTGDHANTEAAATEPSLTQVKQPTKVSGALHWLE